MPSEPIPNPAVTSIASDGWPGRERLRVYPRLFAAAYICIIGVWVGLSHGVIDRRGTPLGGDFISFYSAGRLAVHGDAAAAYDPAQMSAIARTVTGLGPDAFTSWYYPPLLLLLVTPLALLPYTLALVAWLGGTLTAFAVAMRRVLPHPDTMWLAVAFPATFVNVVNGQTGLLSGALLALFISSFDRTPWLAGVALGAMAFKPHFAIAMTVVALHTRAWRVGGSALLTGAVLTLMSVLTAGVSTWQAFLHGLTGTSQLMMDRGGPGWGKMITVYAALRDAGVPQSLAMYLHVGLALIAMLMLLALWSQRGVGTLERVRAHAMLALVTLFASPYALDYDLVMLGPAIACLSMTVPPRPHATWRSLALVVAWVMPLAARPLGMLGVPTAVMVVIALMIMVWLDRHTRRGPHQLEALPRAPALTNA